jgi:hypothetical protein
MQVRFDPFQCFKGSSTPAGLYARQKWLGEAKTPEWKNDFQLQVEALLQDQLPSGSWDHSPIITIERLFALHLTVRERTEQITKALEWLINFGCKNIEKRRGDMPGRVTSKSLQELPFSPGSVGHLITGATLFLASIFGYDDDHRVTEVYEKLCDEGLKKGDRLCGWSCSNNILRALVVHPGFSLSKATAIIVQALGRAQNPSGAWPKDVPFYQTVNALAHLDVRAVDSQLKVSFERLQKTQHRDGTWGRTQKEWNTFLVVHALKNKGLL